MYGCLRNLGVIVRVYPSLFLVLFIVLIPKSHQTHSRSNFFFKVKDFIPLKLPHEHYKAEDSLKNCNHRITSQQIRLANSIIFPLSLKEDHEGIK